MTTKRTTELQRRDLLGVPIAAATMSQAIDFVEEAIRDRRGLHIGVVNAAKIVNMSQNAELREAVLESDVIFADGMSVVWASRLLRAPLPVRVTGIDLMMEMLSLAHRKGYSVYLFGAEQEVIDKVVQRVHTDYPGARVAGARNGYYAAQDEPQIAAAIAAARPDILLVAMTSPKKERFLARWGAQLNAGVYHGVGGSFDVYAGKVVRAPAAWQRVGLEWLYRLLQEPGRLWKRYLYTNTAFVWLVAKGWARRHPFGTTSIGSPTR